MSDSGEFVVVALILGLFAAMAAAGWYVAKTRPARLARLRDAPRVSVESVSAARIGLVLLAGMALTAASAPLLMAAFPDAPLMFLVSILLAFGSVIAPLTFARRLTVDVTLTLEPDALRLEPRGKAAIVVALRQPFTLKAVRIDDEVLVLVQRDDARVHFSYRQGPQFVSLPLTPLPEGWLEDDERSPLFGEEGAILHERLQRLGSRS